MMKVCESSSTSIQTRTGDFGLGGVFEGERVAGFSH
jgi:hypothetical protein